MITQKKGIKKSQIEDEDLSKEKFDELLIFIEGLETTKGALIEILHKAQSLFGYLPRDVQLFVARKLGIPAAEVYGVVSFYSYFTTQKTGKTNISVCMGTACFVKGASMVLEKFKKKLGIEPDTVTSDGLFGLKSVRCIGACGLAPVVSVEDKVFGGCNENKVDEILDAIQYKSEER
jgi:NADH-quinone oxidoreductase subunit E/NADP-reducing hydrogenase subunit HndA